MPPASIQECESKPSPLCVRVKYLVHHVLAPGAEVIYAWTCDVLSVFSADAPAVFSLVVLANTLSVVVGVCFTPLAIPFAHYLALRVVVLPYLLWVCSPPLPHRLARLLWVCSPPLPD